LGLKGSCAINSGCSKNSRLEIEGIIASRLMLAMFRSSSLVMFIDKEIVSSGKYSSLSVFDIGFELWNPIFK